MIVTSADVTVTTAGFDTRFANASLIPATSAGPSVDDVPPTTSETETTTFGAGVVTPHVVASTRLPP